jgi:ATP-dependent DNA helicase RecQ
MINTDETEQYGRARAALWQYWRYEDFRPGQQDVVRAVVSGRDVLAVLPTGGGKSICYQAPAVIDEGITIVISPLIALMQDQVESLGRAGIRAAFMNSTLSARKIDQCWTDCQFGLYKLLYVAPERLGTEDFIERARNLTISRVAVDEAHCISEWGHNFRPSYLQIADAVEALGRPPILALTATATPQVRADIVEHLRLKNPAKIVSGFDRPNIVWSVFQDENKRMHVERVLKGVDGSGIIYAATRRETETWAAWLRSIGVDARAYHAGLPSEERSEVQTAWINGEIRVVTATNAFGMGIDKSDVRFVIHVQMPGTLEAYYQEAGRGGRDGRRSYAVLVFHAADVGIQEQLIDTSHPPAKVVRDVYETVCSMGGVAIGAEADGLIAVDHQALIQAIEAPPGQVSRAIELLEQHEFWRRANLDPRSGLLRISTSSSELKAAGRRKGGALADFLEAVLRSVDASAFRGWTTVRPDEIARRANITAERVEAGFDFLESRGYCTWRAARGSLFIELIGARAAKPAIDMRVMERSLKASKRKLHDMTRFATGIGCRRKHLLAYFGETFVGQCGKCDVCLGRHEEIVITPDDEKDLQRMLRQISSEGVASMENERDTGRLRWLLSEKYITVDEAEPWRYETTDRARAIL